MKKLSLPHLFSVFLLLCSGTVFSQESPELPSVLATCAACHGENGVGISNEIPALGGQNELYLADRLKRFLRPDSGSEIMQGIVAPLGETELRGAASHFSKLPYLRTKQPVDPEKALRGQEVYRQACQLCHGSEGRASAYAEYPLLAGQNLAYMQKTMADILAGRRRIDVVKGSMLDLLSGTPGRIDDALHFFASQEVDPAQMVAPQVGGQKQRRRRFPAAPQ